VRHLNVIIRKVEISIAKNAVASAVILTPAGSAGVVRVTGDWHAERCACVSALPTAVNGNVCAK
jgi:hypothetical protein